MKYSPMEITEQEADLNLSFGQILVARLVEAYRCSRNVIFEIYVMLTVAMAILALFLYCFVQL
ncbi:MAG: hypothetical protein RQ723_10025 [Desulfuromonadales bacterium]|nr:hypothetical protein [Desulfuromonadales bacterium]